MLTMFLALDTWVELYNGGTIPLAQFASMEKDNDILVNIIVKKQPLNTCVLKPAEQFHRFSGAHLCGLSD